MELRVTSAPLSVEEDVETAVTRFTDITKSALATATTLTSNHRTSKPLPQNIARLIKQKRHTRKEWQRTRCPNLKRELNALVERVKAALDQHAGEMWERKIEELDEHIPSVHRLCRSLGRPPTPTRPLEDAEGSLRFDAKDRAEIFASLLETQFTPHGGNDDFSTAATEKVREYFETPDDQLINRPYFSPKQVKLTAQRLPNRKAPGIDGVPNEAIKYLPRKALAAITRIFNRILRTGHFPEQWKKGKVIMLPKPGKVPTKPQSYRPITLLSSLSKLLEKLLLQLMIPHIKPREEQYGFRSEHSTTMQVTRLMNHLAANYNESHHSIVVFLDMEKAFDRVWHEGLLYKLIETTIPKQILRVLQSFLLGRSFVVAVDKEISSSRPQAAGVPQGSCLSPACYALYTNDIPVVHQVHLALFADDAAYYTSGKNIKYVTTRMQRQLDALPEWLDKWKLKVNASKTQAMKIGGVLLPNSLKIQDTEIAWTPKAKYLGVTIDRRLTFKNHLKEIIGKAKGAAAKLGPLWRSRVPTKIKLLVYETYVRSRLTYAAPSWYPYLSATNRKKLQTQQNRCLRRIVGAPRYVRNDVIAKGLNIETIHDFTKRLTTNMFRKADHSNHAHLRNFAPLHTRPPEGRSKRKKMKPQPRDFADLPKEDPDPNASTSNHTHTDPPNATTPTADRLAGPPLGSPGVSPGRG